MRKLKRHFRKKDGNIKKIVVKHINENLKSYFIVVLIFLIGIILGVIMVNKQVAENKSEIKGYIESYVSLLKEQDYEIDKAKLLKTSILNNVTLAVIIWFLGSTVIGMPLIYGVDIFKGYCLGYTISSIIATLGSMKGIFFTISSLLLQNIIIIPSILALSVSGMKLYKSIMQDKRRENIKLEIIRHTIFSIVILIFMLFSSFIEAYISTNFIYFTIKYF